MERKLTSKELKFGMLMHDLLLFPLFFWKADLTIPHTRMDLPEEWRGKQIITKEQKLMLCDRSEKVLVCTARKIAKTLMIERDIIQLGVLNNRRDGGLDEAMFFTPRDSHLAPVRARIFSKINGVRLFRLFKQSQSKTDGGAGTLHFRGYLKWHFRIEGVSGSDVNMAGLRAKYILGDELAFGNDICHSSRGQTALPEAHWKYCGVPNGVRGTPFYRLDQTSAGRTWSRHKYPSSANPLYRSKEAWATLLEFYGGVNTQGFITQAMGEWGTEVFSSFPPGTIATKDLPFLYIELTNKEIGNAGEEVRLSKFIQLPEGVSPQSIYQAVVGWDYGFSPDPCVMTVFYRTSAESLEWFELMRLRLMRVPRPNQGRIIKFLNKLLGGRIMGIVTDDSGCLQTMEDIGYKDLVWWANSAGAVPRLDQFGEPLIDESGKVINIRRKEWANEEFKNAMMYAPLKVPNPYYMWLAKDDESLINELAGTIERRRESGYIEFIAPGKTPGSNSPDDHSSDSCRFGAIAILHAVAPKDVDDRTWEAYAAALGWAGDGSWKAPWDLETVARPLYPI